MNLLGYVFLCSDITNRLGEAGVKLRIAYEPDKAPAIELL